MWKILGKSAIYLDIPGVFAEGMCESAGEGEKADRFRKCINASEIDFIINGETEECSFIVTIPDDVTPEEIQDMAEIALKIATDYQAPFITANGVEQRYKIIITNQHEPELIGLNRTEGYGSGQVFMPIIQSLSSPGRANPKFL